MFNRLVGRKVALVYDTPGSHVTRDYKEREAILLDLRFKLIDTSGLEPFMSCTTIQGRATAITQRVCSSHCNAVHNPQRVTALVYPTITQI
jgi:predicted GTPase